METKGTLDHICDQVYNYADDVYDCLKASSSIICDRLVNYYYPKKPTHTVTNITQTKSNNNDKLSDYSDLIQADNYNKEEESNRLYVDENMFIKLIAIFREPVNIIDNIFLGSSINAASKNVLDKHKIKFIINCAAEIDNHFEGEIKYKNYHVYDDNIDSIIGILEPAYQEIVNFQSTAQGNILVHCVFGRSRSAAIVLYYIMRKLRQVNGDMYTLDEGLKFLKNEKYDINPSFRAVKDVAQAIRNFIEENKKQQMTEDTDEYIINANSSIYNADASIMNSSLITSNLIEDYITDNEIKNNE